jgi:hypothetical protein
MAPLRRAGKWSPRLACAAQGRHASRGRLSSEGLDGALGRSAHAARLVATSDRVVVLARGFADMPRILLAKARLRTWRGRYSAGAATDPRSGVALCASPTQQRALDCRWSFGPRWRVNPMRGAQLAPGLRLESRQRSDERRPSSFAALRRGVLPFQAAPAFRTAARFLISPRFSARPSL